MITIKVIYGFEPDVYGDPVEYWFTVYSDSGESESYVQADPEENRAKISEFINRVRGKHPNEEVIDCTGI